MPAESLLDIDLAYGRQGLRIPLPADRTTGRPVHVVTALCRPGDDGPVLARLLAETGSLGARRHHVRRQTLPRRETEVTVEGHRIRVKVGPHRAKPEHDDVAAAAAATGLPARVVAEQALRQLGPGPG